MITDKMFEWTINVDKPCKFMSKESNVIDNLRETFNNTCYYGSLILEVLKVNRTSMCHIITSNHLAHGAINVCLLLKY